MLIATSQEVPVTVPKRLLRGEDALLQCRSVALDARDLGSRARAVARVPRELTRHLEARFEASRVDERLHDEGGDLPREHDTTWRAVTGGLKGRARPPPLTSKKA